MLCHIRVLSNPEVFLERLARAGCDGVLLEIRLSEDDPRLARKISQLCQQLNLQYWVMPSIGNPPNKNQAWILDVSVGAPQPVLRGNKLDLLSTLSADYLFIQLNKYINEPPNGIFLQTPFAPSAEPFPWTPDFKKYFLREHGYEFQDKWHSLISTTGADDAKVRQDYWETVNTLLGQFLHQCSELSEMLKSTFRHNIIEPELAALSLPQEMRWRRRAGHSIEIIQVTKWPQLLKSTFERYYNGALHVAVSLPEDFDEEPARHFFQQAKALVTLLNQGKNVAKVGLLFPARSARTHYHPDSHRYPRWVGEDFRRIIEYLNALHYDFRLVDENELQNPPCELLVIPSITALATESWAAIEAWIKRGGKVASAGLLPRWSERGLDGELEEHISRATKQTLQDTYDGYLAAERGTALPPHIGYPISWEDASGGRLCSYTPRLNHDAEDARLRLSQILRESLQSDFASQNVDIHYRHFDNDQAERFYLYNNSDQTQQFICRCVPARSAAPSKLAQFKLRETGSNTILTSLVPVWSLFPEIEGGGISLSLTLAPHELHVYEMNFTEEQWHLWRANFTVEEISGGEIRGFAQEDVRPFCVQEKDGKNVQWVAPKILLPAPIWLDESEWHLHEITFSTEIFIPAEWNSHQIMLETRPNEVAISLNVNAHSCGTLLSPPFLFDISDVVVAGQVNSFQLRMWKQGETLPPPTRLVAWPRITLPIEQSNSA